MGLIRLDYYRQYDTILNHTEMYAYKHGKILIHLNFCFEGFPIKQTPAAMLKYYRQRKCLTTRQLAESVGVVPATVLMYERGQFPIPYQTAVAMAEVLEIDRNLLFDEFAQFMDYPLLLKNPVYCVADEIAYNYFYENGGGVCADLSEFDGQHGLSAYNKTDQEKFEDADSTFISPKFVQLMSVKPVSEWIISVGRHEGFIPSRQWIDTQNMLDSIAEKYNRPHRKTNALLAGLVYCPHCGKRLRVISESNRWTNGKPRFKYVCPGYRAGECTFRAVDGVLLDEFVVKQLSNLSYEDSEYFVKLLNQKASDIFKNTQNEQELIELKKQKAQLEAAISNQVKNLREADDSLKRFIQDDVKGLTDELSETEKLLQKLEDSRQSQIYAVRDIEEIKERLLSFEKYAKDAQPNVLVTLIQSFVERIYIVDENDERYCHIFIKGCTKEDYDEFFRATGYISGTRETGAITSKLPLCDSDECSKHHTIFAFQLVCGKLFTPFTFE